MTLTEAQAMTPEERRVKLASLLGAGEVAGRQCPSCMFGRGQGHASFCSAVPDYCNDLNAVHSVERGLPSHLWTDYAMTIRKIIQKECCKDEFYIPGTERAQLIADVWFYCATADQRTTALILTLAP